jgi:hypothetical protein
MAKSRFKVQDSAAGKHDAAQSDPFLSSLLDAYPQ